MGLREAVSGATASRVGSPALTHTQLLLRNIWSPKGTDVASHKDPPTDSVLPHLDTWRRKPGKYFQSAKKKFFPDPLPIPSAPRPHLGSGTCGWCVNHCSTHCSQPSGSFSALMHSPKRCMQTPSPKGQAGF